MAISRRVQKPWFQGTFLVLEGLGPPSKAQFISPVLVVSREFRATKQGISHSKIDPNLKKFWVYIDSLFLSKHVFNEKVHVILKAESFGQPSVEILRHSLVAEGSRVAFRKQARAGLLGSVWPNAIPKWYCNDLVGGWTTQVKYIRQIGPSPHEIRHILEPPSGKLTWKNGKPPCLIGNTSSKGSFSIAMLDYRSVAGRTLRILQWSNIIQVPSKE